MNVLVGIQMSRISAQQPPKFSQLPGNLVRHLLPIVKWRDFVQLRPLTILKAPFPKIEMKSDTQAICSAAKFRSLRRRWPTNHEAGTGNNSLFMSIDDPAVDSSALAKIIGVDNELSR